MSKRTKSPRCPKHGFSIKNGHKCPICGLRKNRGKKGKK